MKNKVLKNFYKTFDVGQVVQKHTLKKYLEQFYGKLKDATLAWRIYDLKQSHYVNSISSNKFIVLDNEKYETFNVDVDSELFSTLKSFNSNMTKVKRIYTDEDNVNISVWNTKVLNKYSVHQVYKHFYIVEIDDSRMESLFYYLKQFHYNVFMSRKTPRIDDYLDNNAILIDNLPKRSPLDHKRSYNRHFISTPKIEKILVDLVVYNKDLLSYDISELKNIYETVFQKHVVNKNRVLNYARTRGLKTKEKVLQLLNTIGE